MRVELLAIALPMLIIAGCKSNESANNTMNVDENLSTTESTTTTDMNASAADNDVIAPAGEPLNTNSRK